MKVYVLVEFTRAWGGGAIIHGVFEDYDDAREAQNALPGRMNCDIEEREVVARR